MKVIAAYLLAVLGGNASPSAENIKNILASVGAEADDVMIELLLSQVRGKDITELIAAGKEKLASFSGGVGAGAGSGAGAAVAPAAAAPAGGAAAAPAAEPKKEEEKEESDDDLGPLFLFE